MNYWDILTLTRGEQAAMDAHYDKRNQIDYKKIVDYLGKGAALGLGTSVLLGMFRALGGKEALSKDTSEDDHIMYIQKKSSFLLDSDGLGITAGVSGALLAYFLGNKLINKIRSQKAQEELDEAQRIAYKSHGYNIVKKAEEDKSFYEETKTVATALASLLALAGAVSTYSYLNHKFPVNKNQFKVENPTTIKLINDDQASYISDDEDEQLINRIRKQASSLELPAFLLHSMFKNASSASDIISTISQGNNEQFEKAIKDVGFESALDLVKGASLADTDPVNDALAALYCVKEASFKNQFNLLVAAEYSSINPGLMKMASVLDDQQSKVAMELSSMLNSCMYMKTIQDLQLHKYASIDPIKIASGKRSANIVPHILNLIQKRANSFLINNINSTDSTDLSNNGTALASKKEQNDIQQDAQNYADSVSNTTKSVSEDQIDEELNEAVQNITSTADLSNLFE